tara:strand:- start:376 stop:549 length:174 start_codon:yes stop_codon:yes gene_type:complete
MIWLYLYASLCFGALWARIQMDEGEGGVVMLFLIPAVSWPLIVPVALAGVFWRRVVK